MGKIISVKVTVFVSTIKGGVGGVGKQKTKFGHIIGFRDKKILCEELDGDYNFVVENGKKKVFSCNPGSAKQIGYLTPEEIMLKR